MIPEQQDIELQKGIYQSIKDNQEALSVTNQLNAKLLAKGLTPIQIVGDGNCLYRSINYLQTSQGTPNQNQFDQIKQAVIQVLDRQLDAPPLIVYQILHGSQIHGNTDLQKVRNYRKKMSRKKQYGGSIELLAISYIYGVTLVVHKMHGTTQVYYPDPNTPITPDTVYHLGLYQFSDVIYDHYFALIPTNQTLSEYNINNYKEHIQKWNETQKVFVQPVIDKSSSKNLQSSIQDVPKTYSTQMINQTPNGQKINQNTTKTQVTQVRIQIQQQNIEKKTVKEIKQNNYKENEKPISQAERKHFSQNGRIVYSQNGTILRLTNFFKRFSVEELIQDSWENVQILEVQNCNITDPQWSFFVNNAHLFPNLRYINIGSNRITRISRGDLQKFKNLRVINFKRLANCPYSTYEYLENLRQKYRNSQDKSDLILPIFRK